MLRRPAALLLSAALSIAACGGGAGTGSNEPSGTSKPAGGGYGGGGYGTGTASPAPAQTTGATGTATASGPTGPTGVVSIVDYAFAPAELTVAAGTTVTWTNTDRRSHTVKSTDGAFESSGTLGTGDTYVLAFPAAGTFSYVCAFHPVMEATITVAP